MSFPYPSGTLLIPSGPSGKHLFIIVTHKCVDGFHLLLSVSTVREGVHYDDACEFIGGEHEFIRHRSYIYYRLADQRRADAIVQMVNKKYFDVRDDLEAVHFQRVCQGVVKSSFIKPWAVKYFLANMPH